MLGTLRPQDGTQTNCRGSDASCKQGLRTNSWSSKSLPVAPLALPKCSSVFDVHTIDLEPRGQQVRSRRIFTASVFPFHRFRTVLTPFFSTVISLFSDRSPCNANGFILTPTVHVHVHVCTRVHVCMHNTHVHVHTWKICV